MCCGTHNAVMASTRGKHTAKLPRYAGPTPTHIRGPLPGRMYPYSGARPVQSGEKCESPTLPQARPAWSNR